MVFRLRLRFRISAALALLALPEAAYWLGAAAASARPEPGDCAVLVLGFPTRADGSPSQVQHLRVQAGAEVFRAQRCDLMVLAGGSPHTPFAEAETMARLAVEAGIPRAQLSIEGRSRDTWENIAFSLPALAGKPKVFLVSDALHVHRAKRYWCRQRRDLCSRAYPATSYRPFRLYGMKWAGLFGETWSWLRDSLRGRPPDPPATRA